jgi:hypothetical protein
VRLTLGGANSDMFVVNPWCDEQEDLLSHENEAWRRLYTAMACLVDLAKTTRFLGRCRHSTAPRS